MVTLIMMMVIRPLNICAVTGVFDFSWSRDRKLEGGKIRSEKQEEGKSIALTQGCGPHVKLQNRIAR